MTEKAKGVWSITVTKKHVIASASPTILQRQAHALKGMFDPLDGKGRPLSYGTRGSITRFVSSGDEAETIREARCCDVEERQETCPGKNLHGPMLLSALSICVSPHSLVLTLCGRFIRSPSVGSLTATLRVAKDRRSLGQPRILRPDAVVRTSPTKFVCMTAYQQDSKDRSVHVKESTHPLVKASTPRHVLVGFGPSLVKPNLSK